LWAAYASVFPRPTHRSVDKKSGQLAHIERWHNTVRQRFARYVRKTLFFSKSLAFHEAVTRWFVIEYNLGSCHQLQVDHHRLFHVSLERNSKCGSWMGLG
jgi:hypothetical protein